ncbi:MAG: AraC family transcriptional regulator [Gammaproteobacteria bacterium]|uniref:Transcriptional regulator, AraC family n=1 Tax=Marinobacter nitratireducens TaxID=1137280 RepID=A0A072MYV8_9GAMM|nr:AraC family transcriptional regulator [Marinobacter nitratireducens]KEF30142.1 Transcriptional regulator, AraC family [Marinobacter nitratireducens]TNE81246.1 MAG: AraC family transcriptional regulator [Gammaproteobacteria bacterium]
MSSLIRATNLWGYDELVRSKGGDPIPLLARHHIPPAEQRDDQSFLVFKHLNALLEDTSAELNDPAFGMMLANYQGLDILGPISVIARSSLTVGEAIQSIAGYLHLHAPALSMAFEPVDFDGTSAFRLAFNIDSEGEAYRRQSRELTIANAVQVMKLLCGETFRPLAVDFPHTQIADQADYHAVYRCIARFERPVLGLYLPASIATLPLTSADHQTWQMAKQYLDSQQAPNAHSLSEDVTRLINTLLPTGQCSSGAIASHLAMHKRTLQRKLAEEGVTYEQLLNEERIRLARQYFMEPNLGLSQITGLLGYSEQSALSRACKEWFGVTPKTYRKQLQN